MPVEYRDWITRNMVRDEREKTFVFGDNAKRVGLRGQASAMRGEPNARGVATLYAPGLYYDASPRALWIVTADLAAVASALSNNRVVVVPRDGLGTGLARLKDFRPDLHNLIVSFFRAADGEPCEWEFV